MRYGLFKPQTVRNSKCSYHCSGPLESCLYTQMCLVLDNFLILIFLSQIYRTRQKKKKKLENMTYSGCPHAPQLKNTPFPH